MVTWRREHILSISLRSRENIILCRRVESILIEVEAQYELIYLIADSIELGATVPISLQNVQSSTFYAPLWLYLLKVF